MAFLLAPEQVRSVSADFVSVDQAQWFRGMRAVNSYGFMVLEGTDTIVGQYSIAPL